MYTFTLFLATLCDDSCDTSDMGVSREENDEFFIIRLFSEPTILGN